jgi:hypothetical protein
MDGVGSISRNNGGNRQTIKPNQYASGHEPPSGYKGPCGAPATSPPKGLKGWFKDKFFTHHQDNCTSQGHVAGF